MVPPVLSSAKSLTIFTIFTLTSILVSLAKHDPVLLSIKNNLVSVVIDGTLSFKSSTFC